MAVALLEGMSPPTTALTGNTPRNLGPYLLNIDAGPSWLNVNSSTGESAGLFGYQTGLRLGSQYSLAENVHWNLQGVFSYSNYSADHGSVSRVGVGFETGPEFTLIPNGLGLSLYAGFHAGFYYSEGVDWPSTMGSATFDNQMVSSLTLRPSMNILGGVLTLSYLYGHDFGLQAPGATPVDPPEGFTADHHSVTLSVDPLRLFYAFRADGFEGQTDSFEQFILGIKPSALIEGSYNYNLDDPSGRDGAPGLTPFRTNHPFHDRVRLNLIEVALERPSTPRSPLGFRLDLGFGQDPISFAPRSSVIENVIGERDDPEGLRQPDTQYFALQQAYMTYRLPILAGLTFRAGQFGTPVGNEVPEGPLNPFLLITRGLNNTLSEPFFHAGAEFFLRLSETEDAAHKVTSYREILLGAFNGWDSTLGHEGGPTFALGYTQMVNPSFTYAGTYLLGKEGDGVQGLLNLNAAWTVHDSLNLGVNLDLGHGNDAETQDPTLWFGLGLYQQFAPVSWFNLAAREEVFTDRDGARTSTEQTLLSAALAANFLIRHEDVPGTFGLGAEIRHDESVGREEGDASPFLSGSDPTNGNTTFTLRASWRYPSE